MSIVENRVVNMEFNNSRFEQNAKISLNTLQKFKMMMDVKNGNFSGLKDAFKDFSMNAMSNAVDNVTSKFNAMDAVGRAVLTRLTNSAMDAGEKIVKALTLDPVTTGFQEYETQINATKVILANTKSKGSTMDDVTNSLQELNTYADKTIYNFTQMTENISRFTAAGVDLDKSTSAIKGIANLAALSGSSSAQASNAMYQLSQSLAAGKVTLQDWNSVVNANMGGENFQKVLRETSKAMGTGGEEAIKKYGSFRESLTRGKWLTTDVLTQSLEVLTGDLDEAQLKTMGYSEEASKELAEMGQSAMHAASDITTISGLWDVLKEEAQSSWTNTWQMIIGDYEEAKELLTAIGNAVQTFIGNMNQSRLDKLKVWKELGGRDSVIKGAAEAMKSFSAIFKEVSKAWNDVFGVSAKDGGKALYNLSEGFKTLTTNLKPSATFLENVHDTVAALLQPIKAVEIVLKTLGSYTAQIAAKSFGILATTIISITGPLGNVVDESKAFIKVANLISGAITVIGEAILSLLDIVSNGLSSIANPFNKFVSNLLGTNEKFTDVTSNISKITSAGGSLASSMNKAGEATGNFSGIIALINTVSKTASNGLNQMKEVIASIPLEKVGSAVNKIFEEIQNVLGKIVTNKNISIFFQTLKEMAIVGILYNVRNAIAGLVKPMDNATGFIGKFKEALSTFSDIPEKVSDILDGVTSSLKTMQATLRATVLEKIGIAMILLAASVTMLSDIDGDKLGSSLGALTTMFGELAAMLYFIDQKLIGDLPVFDKAPGMLIKISAAVYILASALKKMASVDQASLWSSLGVMTILLAELTGVALALGKWGGKIKTSSVQLILMAEAVNILSTAVGKIAALPADNVDKALNTVSTLLGELVATALTLGKWGGKMKTSAVAIIAMAEAVKILSDAVVKLSSIDLNSMGNAMAGLGSSLGSLVLAMIAMGQFETGGIFSAGGAYILAQSLSVLVEPIKAFSKLKLSGIGKSLSEMFGVLAEMVAYLAASNAIGGGLAGAASLLIMSEALKSIAAVMVTFASFNPEQGLASISMLGGSLIILSAGLASMTSALPGAAALLVAAIALDAITPALLVLGSMSLESIIKSLGTLALTFIIFGVAGTALAAAELPLLAISGALLAFGAGCALVGVGILAAAAGLALLGDALVSLGTTVVANAAIIVAGITTLITSIMKAISNNTTTIASVVYKLVLSAINAIAEHGPEVVTSVITMIVNLINAIASCVGMVIDAAMNLAVSFIEGLAQGIVNNTDRLLEAVNDLMLSLEYVVLDCLQRVVEDIPFLNDLVEDKLGEIEETVGKHGKTTSEEYAKGMKKGKKSVKKSSGELTSTASKTLSSAAKDFNGHGSSGGQSFAKGVGSNKNKKSSMSMSKALSTSGLDALAKQNDKFKTSGGNAGAGFGKGIGSQSNISTVVSKAKDLASKALSAFNKAFDVHSPSRKTYWTAQMVIKGFVNGLSDHASAMNTAAKDSADGALNAMSNALLSVFNIADDVENYNPTITPTLDLSEIQNGIGYMDSLLNNSDLSYMGTYSYVPQTTAKGTLGDAVDKLYEIAQMQNQSSGNNGTVNYYTVGDVAYSGDDAVGSAVEQLTHALQVSRRA